MKAAIKFFIEQISTEAILYEVIAVWAQPICPLLNSVLIELILNIDKKSKAIGTLIYTI